MKSSVHRIQFVWLEGGARGHQYEGVSMIPEIPPPPPREGGLGWAPTLLGRHREAHVPTSWLSFQGGRRIQGAFPRLCSSFGYFSGLKEET